MGAALTTETAALFDRREPPFTRAWWARPWRPHPLPTQRYAAAARLALPQQRIQHAFGLDGDG